MKVDPVRSIIIGNLEAIEQGIRLISLVTEEQYVFTGSPYIQSSIGQHFRHVIDMFLVVSYPDDPSIIDYDSRRRGALVETSRDAALSELSVIKVYMNAFLADLSDAEEWLDQEVLIKTEVTIDATRAVTLKSNKLRELVFIGAHAVHHYALISVIAKIQGVVLEEAFGVAPATATFLRDEAGRLSDGVGIRETHKASTVD